MTKGTTPDEKLKEVEQKIHKLQLEKQKIKNKMKAEEKRKRDHVMILVGATLLTHFNDEIKTKLINGNDEQIKSWVHSLFKKNEPATARNEAPETEQY